MLARICAAIVGVVFCFAGAMKTTAWQQWRADAARQKLWAPIVIVIPAIELILGAILIVFSPSPNALGLATLLLVVFTSFLAIQVLTKSTVPCACFGARSSRPPAWKDVARNGLLIALLFVSAVAS